MTNSLTHQVRELLASYVDVDPANFKMEADLDLAYDMDSTELTELAKEVEQRFGVRATKSQRDDWSTGNDLCRFLNAQLVAEGTGA